MTNEREDGVNRAAVAAWIGKRLRTKTSDVQLLYWERLGVLDPNWTTSVYATTAMTIAAARKGGATLREVAYAVMAEERRLTPEAREALRQMRAVLPEIFTGMLADLRNEALPLADRVLMFNSIRGRLEVPDWMGTVAKPGALPELSDVEKASEVGQRLLQIERERDEIRAKGRSRALFNEAKELAFKVDEELAAPATVPGRKERVARMVARMKELREQIEEQSGSRASKVPAPKGREKE